MKTNIGGTVGSSRTVGCIEDSDDSVGPGTINLNRRRWGLAGAHKVNFGEVRTACA